MAVLETGGLKKIYPPRCPQIRSFTKQMEAELVCSGAIEKDALSN